MTICFEIKPPSTCPSCDSLLEWKNDALYCTSAVCSSKLAKAIEHFAQTLKIKGLGPRTIDRLNLKHIEDIYLLDEEFISEQLSSERLAAKLMAEIENSKKASLNIVLPAFSIPLVGKVAAKKLASVCESIDEITEETCKQAGLGAKTTSNLLNWLDIHYDLIEALPFNFLFDKPKILNKSVCISGSLTKSKMTKAAAGAILETHGYQLKPNLTKDISILINESGKETAKTKQARESGIQIITNLKDLIGV